MSGLISQFPHDGVVTVNRVVLKEGFSVDDLQERVAELCDPEEGQEGYCVKLDDGEQVHARSVVVATGGQYRRLPLDREPGGLLVRTVGPPRPGNTGAFSG